MKKSYIIHTLGCKANLSDSQFLEGELQKSGWKPSDLNTSSEEEVSLCIINSCTVTNEADLQSRKTAHRYSKKYPNAKIVYTGCSAEVYGEKLKDTKGIDFILGNQDKTLASQLILNALEKSQSPIKNSISKKEAEVLGRVESYSEILSTHPVDRSFPAPFNIDYWFTHEGENETSQSAKTRAFLKIQEGCNSFCTFCIIPYGRGPSRSLRPRQIIELIQKLVLDGVKEVVLTGTNIGDYGLDSFHIDPKSINNEIKKSEPLFELIQWILNQTTLPRLRLSSLDPTEITDSILELMKKEKRLCAHFHISLQSPHTQILRLMKRGYGFEDVESCLKKIESISKVRGPVFVGMDLITGFPGETKEYFDWTVETLSKLPWTRLHVFPYSEREGTPATRLKGSVEIAERKRRSKILQNLSLKRVEQFYHEILRTPLNKDINDVLIESKIKGPDGKKDWYSGYTQNYLKYLTKTPFEINSFQKIYPKMVSLDRASGDAHFIS